MRGRARRARAALERVGLGDRVRHVPSELSGGQKQRVAIARALINEPSIVLADEPTGALDSKSTEEIMELLVELNNAGTTIVVITHEEEVADFAKRVVRLRDGVISSDEPVRERAQLSA
jgi:putative ABC transport system ATP-binding protein